MRPTVETLFALADRKVEAFDFSVKKVKGGVTGNEFYAVAAECIVNGTPFSKKVLTTGCPANAIDIIVKELLKAAGVKTPGITEVKEGFTLRPVTEQVAPGIRVALPTSTTQEFTVAPGIKIVVATEEVDEDDFDDTDYDDECDECDCADCRAARGDVAPGITLTPVNATASSNGPHACPYCGKIVAPNFAFCPGCGGQQ